MKARRYPMRPTTKPAAQVFALYGVAARDRTEAVLMFFKDEESLVDFKTTFPGMYRKMTLEGVDYEALTVASAEVLDQLAGSRDEPTCHECAVVLQDDYHTFCEYCEPFSCDGCNVYVAEGDASYPDENTRLCAKCAGFTVPEPTCPGCDRPLITGSKYCSFWCEESDRFPAPQDDQEKFTNKGDKQW